MKAPMPWFGGKSVVAPEVWARIGRTDNYVEPFCGSCALLLANPHPAKTETVNDADAWLANFWRASRADPERVAQWADYPVSEVDLLARYRWLFYRQEAKQFQERMKADPDYFDAKSAGWWLWGICAWIGSGWGQAASPERHLPHLGDAGRGINRKLPHLGDAGQGARYAYILSQMTAIADRLRDTRVACGDWRRVLGPSVTEKHGMTAVLLDPPYADAEHSIRYAGGGLVWEEVCAWAESNGANPLLRIALFGYAGTWAAPAEWRTVSWKAHGGMATRNGKGKANGRRETIWFSPACLPAGLDFGTGEAA